MSVRSQHRKDIRSNEHLLGFLLEKLSEAKEDDDLDSAQTLWQECVRIGIRLNVLRATELEKAVAAA